MKRLGFVNTLSLLCTGVYAHGGIYNYTIDGVDYPGHNPWLPEEGQNSIQRRWWPDPIYGVHHPYLSCNRGNPLATKNPTLHAPARAGSTVTASYLPIQCPTGIQTPTTPSTPGDDEKPMGCDSKYKWVHDIGPLLAYMAACNGPCEALDPTDKKVWFKIYETGLKPEAERRLDWPITYGDNWVQADTVWRRGTWDLTIPRNLKPGNYLLRHEIIMLGSAIPIQMYPHCVQLTVTGDGDQVPEMGSEYLVQFPGAYSDDDPGIAIANRFYYGDGGHATFNYTIPGPKVWTGEA
ncbi:cellulose-growth-specific protein [Cladorrhinum sp. PSN259]|nr:cellulose-growth-specific protein [Cladorrhinum sp. PSN259]